MTGPGPYKLPCDYGTTLQVSPTIDGRASLRILHSGPVEAVSVRPADFPAVTAAMYRAAGLPVPVMLERPAIDLDEWVQSGPVRMGLTRDGDIGVGVGSAQSCAGPEAIRHIAALLAAYADAAEPDPADVAELAAVLQSAMPDSSTYTSWEDHARAVLRAGWKREPADG